MEASDQLHDPAALPPGKSPQYLWTANWVGPRAGLHAVAERKKPSSPLPEIEPRSPARILVSILTGLPRLLP